MTRSILLIVVILVAAPNCHAGNPFFGHPILDLTTKEQVRERFGRRISSGVEDGRAYDEVRYHGKPYEELKGPGRGMLIVMTCGLSEMVLIPRDLCKAGRDLLVGHKIRFDYDESGQVISCWLDGEGPLAVISEKKVDQPGPSP